MICRKIMRNFVGQSSHVKQWQKFCTETLKKGFLECEKNGFKKHFPGTFSERIFSCFAILISTLLLQTHAPHLYSLALTRFCWNLESSTTNAWNAKNAIFPRASRVTFGPWITWRSRIAAAQTNPNRACQLGFDLSVHVFTLYAISQPYSVLIESGKCSSLTSIAERQNCLPMSWQAHSVRSRSLIS